VQIISLFLHPIFLSPLYLEHRAGLYTYIK